MYKESKMLAYWILLCFYFFMCSNCEWLPWSHWAECLGKCHHQSRMRHRHCNSSTDLYDNNVTHETVRCPGDDTEFRFCRTHQCVDEEREDNLIRNITIACIMFVPGIVIFVIVGLRHAAREKRIDKRILETETKEKKQLLQKFMKSKRKSDVTDAELHCNFHSSKRGKFTSASLKK